LSQNGTGYGTGYFTDRLASLQEPRRIAGVYRDAKRMVGTE